MIEELVPDGLWQRVEPLLPPPRPRRHRYPGRRPVGDRAALAGIVFVLKTGIAWNQLPTGRVGCSGVTCWRRLRDWIEAGVWPAKRPGRWRRSTGRDELLAYWTPTGRRGVSNGPTEAVSALIKKVKRVGHGFRNLANYRLRLLPAVGLDWNTVP